MSAIFSDIKERMSTPKQREPIPGIQYSEVLYADDTLVFGTYTKHINMLIREIQRESKYYNMELNLDKCINLTINRTQSSIKYSDGTMILRKQAARYLDTLLTDTVDNRQELVNRIADAARTCNRLKLFWNKAQTTIIWKIHVFHAIVQSKLLYGLEATQLNQTELAKLNAFQIKCYRRILHISPTSIDRSWTNQAVKDLLEQQHGVTVTSCSRLWMLRISIAILRLHLPHINIYI